MTEAPLMKELQDLCGSDKVHTCFKFLFSQEIPMDEAMCMWLGERRDEIRISIDKRTDRMHELFFMNHDEEVAAEYSYESLREIQIMENRLMGTFSTALVQVRELITKKQEVIEELKEYD